MALAPSARRPTATDAQTTTVVRASARETAGPASASRIITTHMRPECVSSARTSFWNASFIWSRGLQLLFPGGLGGTTKVVPFPIRFVELRSLDSRGGCPHESFFANLCSFLHAFLPTSA